MSLIGGTRPSDTMVGAAMIGPGVSDENLGKLFTPNFTTKSSGTGLGLAICRNIIEKCNGEIVYQRSFGLKGACFTVRLPKYPA